MIHRNISPGVEMCGDNTGTACASVSKTNKDSVTGSQYFVARRGSVATILLSYPEFRIHDNTDREF